MLQFFNGWRRQAGLCLLAVATAERVAMIFRPRMISEAAINFFIAFGILVIVWPRTQKDTETS